MKNNFKKIIALFIFALCIFVNNKADASFLSIKPSSDSLSKDEQFYVDVNLNTEGKIINGIEGSVSFPDNISFVRAEEGNSIVNLWVEKPALSDGSVKFSGIIPNGFSGVIDPFNPDNKLPGLIIRLIFETKKEGDCNISISKAITTLNDGLGTIDNITPSSAKISIQNISNPYIYKTSNDVAPELSASVVRDPNIENNKYVLIFDAKDKQTGIKEVLIKEGSRPWKKIESPYLLEDQSRHSIITVQATNYSGSSIAINIDALPYKLISFINIIILIFILVGLLFIIKKFYEKYK